MEDAKSRAKDAASRAGANLRNAASWLKRRAGHHLLRHRPEFWVDERVVKSCYGCEREFPGALPGFKHHCRACGKVFCGACSSKTLHLARDDDVDDDEETVEPSRVCDFCFQSRDGSQAAKTPAPSTAGGGGGGESMSTSRADSPADAMDDSTHTLANSADALARLRISALSNQPSPAGQLLGSAARRSRQRRLAPSSDGPSSDDSSDDEFADDATQTDTRGHEATETTGGDASPGDLTMRDLATAPSSVAPASPLSPWRRRAARARGRPLAVSDRARREAAEASRDPSLWARPINSDSSFDDETPPDPPQTIPDASLDASRAALLKHDTLAGGSVLGQSDIDAWTPRVAKLASKASKCVSPRREHVLLIGDSAEWMNPASYVRCKKIPGGLPDDSDVVIECGEMFTKNVAHKRMPTVRTGHVRVVLLSGALEYQRANAGPKLSSLDTLLDQEHEHLRGAVARINSIGVDVLVVEQTVSRFARELLLERGVSLVINAKPSCVRRLERVTGAVAIGALDQLREECVGSCGTFRVETHTVGDVGELESGSNRGGTKGTDEGTNGSTTMMSFGGCAVVGGGCCVLLRGASEEKLKVVKAAVCDATLAEVHGRRGALWRGARGHSARPGIDPATAALSFERFRISACSFCASTGHLCDAPNDAIETVMPYGEGDLPLGEFLREATSPPVERERCSNPECDEPPESHVRTYYLRGGRATLRLFRPADAKGAEGADTAVHDVVVHWTRRRVRRTETAGLGALGLYLADVRDSACVSRALPREALEMSLGRFLETAVASNDSAYLDHAHFFAMGGAVACFSFDVVTALRVSPPTEVIAAAEPAGDVKVKDALSASGSTDPNEGALLETPETRLDAMDADPGGCVARYLRTSEYAVHLAAARWAAANPPSSATGGTGNQSPSTSRSRSHSRKGSTVGGGSMETLNPNPNPLVVDGPDAMLLHHRGHLRHAFDVESTSDAKDAKTDAKTRVKTAVTAYYPLQFDALRGASIADGDEGFAASLSEVAKWDGGAKGGKSGSLFGKTEDDRFIVKQLTRVELNAFLGDFGPSYFKHIRESLPHEGGTGEGITTATTCLARIVGAYRVSVGEGVDEVSIDFVVIENIFNRRNVTSPEWRTYDLKGSLRARFNNDDDAGDMDDDCPRHSAHTGIEPGTDNRSARAVLLDENLQSKIATDPVLCSLESKFALDAILARDTAFLANEGVMDYSLLAGIDRGTDELVVGVIDYLRLYTWDKQLETYVKFTGVLGGGVAAEPTVISPVQYRRRFRKAMARYFVVVPS